MSLLCLIFSLSSCVRLHEREHLYMHAPHQHANSTPPFRKVWLRACLVICASCIAMNIHGEISASHAHVDRRRTSLRIFMMIVSAMVSCDSYGVM